MGGRFVTRIAQSPQHGVEGILGEHLQLGLDRREHQLRLVRVWPDVPENLHRLPGEGHIERSRTDRITGPFDCTHLT